MDQEPRSYKVQLLSKIEIVETHYILAKTQEEAVEIAKEEPWEDFWEHMVVREQTALLTEESQEEPQNGA